jgi:sugar lactone lactonase YvrE
MIRTRGTLVFGLLLALGCRAVRNDYVPSDNDGAAPPTKEDAGFEPTRLEPPIVHAAPNVFVATMAGSDVPGAADGKGSAASFDNPVGVALDASGSLLVAEYDGGRIRKLSPEGTSTTLATGFLEPFGVIATVNAIFVQTDRDPADNKGANTGTLWRLPLEGGKPQLVATLLGRPRGLAQLLDGRIVLSDRTLRTISILDPADNSVKFLAGGPLAGLVDGRGANARFSDPYGLGILPDGSLVIADRDNHCIRKVTLDGTVSIYAGDGKPGMKDDVDRLQSRFDAPADVVADAIGNVYVSDVGNKRIRRISPTGIVETLAGDGTRGFADGVGVTARFYAMEQLEISPDGKILFVADGTGGEDEKPPYNRIRRITL